MFKVRWEMSDILCCVFGMVGKGSFASLCQDLFSTVSIVVLIRMLCSTATLLRAYVYVQRNEVYESKIRGKQGKI